MKQKSLSVCSIRLRSVLPNEKYGSEHFEKRKNSVDHLFKWSLERRWNVDDVQQDMIKEFKKKYNIK